MPSKVQPHRKRIRLPADAYLDAGNAWSVTIGTKDRIAAFADHVLASRVSLLFIERCATVGARLDLFCLMPDHAHLLVYSPTVGLIDVIRDVKSRSTRLWWEHGGTGPLWQRSFHDRGLRTPADYERAAAYILDNPVRAGLVTNWDEYPLLGGLLLAEAMVPE